MSAKQQIPIRRYPPERRLGLQHPPVLSDALHDRRHGGRRRTTVLRKFGVPFWALARVFGGDPMSWVSHGVRAGPVQRCGNHRPHGDVARAGPLADEHHQGLDGQKVYIATTVGNGCCLGAEPDEAAGSDKLKVAYQVFKDEACDVSPKYAPKTVSTDGWKGTQAAWKMLFTKVVILLCFVHGWLKIRDRAKHLKEVFAEVSRRVWDTYHAPDRRSFAQRLRVRSASGRPDTSQGSSWRRSWTCVASATAGRLPTATPAATARATCLTD